MKNKIKVFTTPWHTMHFHDLFNALKPHGFKFYLCPNTSKKWHKEARPIPKNVEWVPYYEKGTYDFAILDVDQQCVNDGMGKTLVFKEFFKEIQDIPKVIINHGSPVYPSVLKRGDYDSFEKAEQRCKDMMRELVGDTPMVVNSYEAATPREWGWGHPIHHGMNPKDWWDLSKEPRVFTSLSPGGCDMYYNRECMNEVAQILRNEYGHELWWAKVNIHTEESFDLYRETLGRSLVYLDVSFRTPLNRARTEAMFSGCCVVQVEGGHDLERFADTSNMILVKNNPKIIAQTCNDLIENNYKKCIKIGQRGKQTAKTFFNYKRYADDWIEFLKENKII